THTSGLKVDFGPNPTFKSVDEAVTEAYKLPLAYETGSKSEYGLIDFVVLTKVLEKVSGRSFGELVQEKIVQPLKMQQTRFDDAGDEGGARNWQPIKYRATTYRWTGAGQRAYSFFYPKFSYSAGGMFSSASDLAKFLIAIGEGKLLKPASLEE